MSRFSSYFVQLAADVFQRLSSGSQASLVTRFSRTESSSSHSFMSRQSVLAFLLVFLTTFAGVGNAWGEDVTDELTASDLSATGTTYTVFSNVAGSSSDAIYAGQSAKDASGNIQLRSKNSNSGIISTKSGGRLKSVTITVGSGTNTVDVYGSNTAYTTASDLYGNNKGTKIGSVSSTGTISVQTTDDYAYVGIRSNNGALYLTKVEVTWEVEDSGDPGSTEPANYNIPKFAVSIPSGTIGVRCSQHSLRQHTLSRVYALSY